ncbi:Geranylgeranyl transferase type-2 subunit alpha [Wickerhamomyces ciferrii]|uniref:Geranylgeranyl transferase type-2 subunit alpha n=1 Tax=Wickerhamomyces ciferrii (strain ATCC 14091 / BCRC 22168 / CBS 111 / JCM 3599 / NBRC 0793 / NRRL Y-1031 F-60-10) TaxID=1206466 RepID=K0KF64_WICCF|nr:Geranylgeranyl transferase type-2 subunit alpha [Wickerhamomyces ciferrii]CCH40862.1 Geranylgeranyl transferase type-2 subunit alpha [Wickerhamomyces ciferrii]
MHNVKRQHLSEQVKKQRQLKDANKIKSYKALQSQVLQLKNEQQYNAETFKLSTDLLYLNPEFYTIWNYRRDIISNYYQKQLSKEELIEFFNKELGFIMMKLKEYPKVYWIWNHRVWILENHPQVDWEFELGIVSKLLTMDSRNFHGWHYRRFIISKLETSTGESLALREFDYTTEKINKDFSNFSAWHNRTKLIPILLNSKPTTRFESSLGFLKEELGYLKNAMYTDPQDQSVWIYLRWLLTSDIFIKTLDKDTYIGILEDELKNVKELNELETEDNGVENNWCLKTIVTIEGLLDKTKNETKFTDEIEKSLIRLKDIDPLRKNRYTYLSENYFK